MTPRGYLDVSEAKGFPLCVVTHYHVSDAECIGDYCEVTIHNAAGDVIKTYGDHYHDKGLTKAEGFVDCLKWLHPKLTFEYRDVADYED